MTTPSLTSRDGLYITLVFFGAHQRAKLFRIRERELEEPDPAFRVLVDHGGRGSERVIDRDDFAGHRTVDLARGLHRFDHGGFRALLQLLPDGREFDIDDIAQLRLRVGRDADHADIAVEPDPFVVPGVSHVGHPSPLASASGRLGPASDAFPMRDSSGAVRTASARSWLAVPCHAPAR